MESGIIINDMESWAVIDIFEDRTVEMNSESIVHVFFETTEKTDENTIIPKTQSVNL